MHESVNTIRPVSNEVDDTNTDDAASASTSWWDRYGNAIRSLPDDTRAVIEDDARYVADHALNSASLQTGDNAQNQNGQVVVTGMVVGSVQSGKTASMLAVAALLLDRQVDILIVLAGTRVALWLQTYERLLRQLDGSDVFNAWIRNSERVLVPQPEDILSGSARVDPYRYLRGVRRRVVDAVQNRKPMIFVIPKEDDHLLAVAKFLSEHTDEGALERRGYPLRMVVLDDEADDASILDAQDGSRITPQFIQYLWSSDKCAPATRNKLLQATYIAYTATPQANYLQRSHNPLAPRNFHAALRVPSDRGDRTPRLDTYFEHKGLNAFYCGGEHYYERLRDMPGDPCVTFPFVGAGTHASATELAQHARVRWEMIGSAMRSFFVAGAIRLLLDGRRFSAVSPMPTELASLRATLPHAHSMLYHPSALKEAHFQGAEDLVRWCKALPGEEADVILDVDEFGNPRLEIDADGLATRLSLEEPEWCRWVSEFAATAAGLSALPGYTELGIGSIAWDSVRDLLVNEVFPNVKLRVLNSDPRADDRPIFEATPIDGSSQLWRAPRDVYTIFVAGNVLSRGLTVEGLTTSLFARSAREPAADTQMQMQRWFGYRGPHLPFCRVFLYEDQLTLFRKYHYNDVALKREILSRMDGHQAATKGVLVLQGDSFWATTKVDSRRIPLHPGATPAIRLLESPDGMRYEHNLEIVQNFINDNSWEFLNFPEGVARGLIRSKPISMLELAEFLERLRYSAHDPDLQLPISQRWASLQAALNLPQPLFRPPGEHPGPMAVEPSGCPYSIAAYLRLWHEALQRHDLPGMQPTDNSTRPWSSLDLAAYRATAPRFYVGLRFGAERPTTNLTFNGKAFPMMRRGLASKAPLILETLWGSRNPTDRWKGDQVFDYHFHNPAGSPRILADGAWRQRGEPGLLLIHPVIDLATKKETVAFGLAIPKGGPDHVAALRVAE
ncbi:Z1 domain-containing protein [Burkholderia cepacia]|uniref:Z1 domain-containing protein n=1 Tax=Burkholderia cepacia TaxID=292 RepID=UPI002AB60141|nr:Z1 domain-containing protein [Burkholderia cepacia]